MKKLPIRLCVGCNNPFHKRELIRIVKDKENNFSIDLNGKKPGRGAYICKNIDCLNMAYKKKRLENSFKMAVDNNIYEALKKELEEIDE